MKYFKNYNFTFLRTARQGNDLNPRLGFLKYSDGHFGFKQLGFLGAFQNYLQGPDFYLG